MPLANYTASLANSTFVEIPNLVLERARTVPEGISKQLEEAVKDFIETSKVGEGIDRNGLMLQTYKAMTDAMVFGQGEFWIARMGDELVGYSLARIVTDVDGKLTYWVSQAWWRKDYRNTFHVKQAWETVRQRAKDCLCSHLVIVAGRNPKAYKRFLKVHDYATLLKEDF